jgi:hypothetical protein
MMRRTVGIIALAAMALNFLIGCAEVRQGTRTAGTYVGEAAAVPDEFNRGINEGYRDDPGPNPYNR